MRTMCSGRAPASASTATTLASAWRVCATKSSLSNGTRHSNRSGRPRIPAGPRRPRRWRSPGFQPGVAAPASWGLPQLEALQLAGLGARQRRAELDRPRVFVGRDGLLDELLQLARRASSGLVARPGHDEALTIWPRSASATPITPHSATLGVQQQRALHLGAGDVVAAADDHVVGARLVDEEAVGVDQVGVAGEVPALAHVVASAARRRGSGSRSGPSPPVPHLAARQRRPASSSTQAT